jgi:hypothetical protein
MITHIKHSNESSSHSQGDELRHGSPLLLRQLTGRNQHLLCAAPTTAHVELSTVLAVSYEPTKHQHTSVPSSSSDMTGKQTRSTHATPWKPHRVTSPTAPPTTAQFIRGSICRAQLVSRRDAVPTAGRCGIGTPSWR